MTAAPLYGRRRTDLPSHRRFLGAHDATLLGDEPGPGPLGLLTLFVTAMAAKRRLKRFRSLDRRQLRDLGISHLDQW